METNNACPCWCKAELERDTIMQFLHGVSSLSFFFSVDFITISEDVQLNIINMDCFYFPVLWKSHKSM